MFLISFCLSQVFIGSDFNQDVEQCLSENQNLTNMFWVRFSPNHLNQSCEQSAQRKSTYFQGVALSFFVCLFNGFTM